MELYAVIILSWVFVNTSLGSIPPLVTWPLSHLAICWWKGGEGHHIRVRKITHPPIHPLTDSPTHSPRKSQTRTHYEAQSTTMDPDHIMTLWSHIHVPPHMLCTPSQSAVNTHLLIPLCSLYVHAAPTPCNSATYAAVQNKRMKDRADRADGGQARPSYEQSGTVTLRRALSPPPSVEKPCQICQT